MAVKHALHEAYTPCPCVYVTSGFWRYRAHAARYAWWEIKGLYMISPAACPAHACIFVLSLVCGRRCGGDVYLLSCLRIVGE